MNATLIADRYEVIRPLGRGAFAHTLLARDTQSERQVAIKVLHPRVAQDWKSFELFEREATVLRSLRHPGIPAVYDTLRTHWEGAEVACLVMEYVEGTSLAAMIGQGQHLDRTQVLQLFLDMLGLLDYLHTRVPPILHRDIKPANIIVRPDFSPALVDFGAVRNVFHSADESGSTMVGTYGYMPYEQTMGQATPSSDLYALAATFLHLVTGRAPPEFMNDGGQLSVPFTLPCGEPLRSVLSRLLAGSPTDRFASAREARSASLAGVSGGASAVLIPQTAGALSLGPTPRPLTGDVKQLLKAVSYSPGRILASTEKASQGWSVADVFLLGFFSVITAGILPAVVWSTWRARRRRLKPFLMHGLPATARVLDMVDESIGFEIKLTRVRYEFEVGGRLFRDFDRVLPVIARRWDSGSLIQVLYLPDRDWDSVIISTS